MYVCRFSPTRSNARLSIVLCIALLVIPNTSGVCALHKRGAVIEWLEQLGYGAESRSKACVRGSASPCGDWKTLYVSPTVDGYLFRIREG